MDENEINEPGFPNDLSENNLPNEAGKDKHLEGFATQDKKMIQLMADIIVSAVLNS